MSATQTSPAADPAVLAARLASLREHAAALIDFADDATIAARRLETALEETDRPLPWDDDDRGYVDDAVRQLGPVLHSVRMAVEDLTHTLRLADADEAACRGAGLKAC